MKRFKPQWYDMAVNPVEGCTGCELHPTLDDVREVVVTVFVKMGYSEVIESGSLPSFEGTCPTEVFLRLPDLVRGVARLVPDRGQRKLERTLRETLEHLFRCPTATHHRRHQTEEIICGDERRFEKPILHPGRTKRVARQPSLGGQEREERFWLNGLPRMIRIGEKGDALSKGVPFRFLEDEIMDVADSSNGRRHLWLWPTRFTNKLVRFAGWVDMLGYGWPENVVPMPQISRRQDLKRIDQLRKTKAMFRGVCFDPLWEPLEPDLTDVDWVVIGGDIGKLAKPFHLEWAKALIDQCVAENRAVFMSHVGSNPFHQGKAGKIDAPFGEWQFEWPLDFQIRQFPSYWHETEVIAA